MKAVNWNPRESLLLALLAAFSFPISSNCFAQSPAQTRGVWILPNQFRNDGTLTGTNDIPKDDILEKQGTRLLEQFKVLNPSLNAKVLSGDSVTRSRVIREIRRQLDAFEGKNQPCMFILYYGGHGIRPSSRSKASSYLAMQGAEVASTAPEQIRYDDMISVDEVLAITSEYEHVYFQAYIDCCYSANTRIASDLAFSSKFLGNNGFAICSSAFDRQAIVNQGKSLTMGLIDVLKSAEFSDISTPKELFNRVQLAEPSASLPLCYLPSRSDDTLVQWPLPKLCYLVIDFGQIIEDQSVSVAISDRTGKLVITKTLSNGDRNTPVFARALAVPRSKLKMQIKIGDGLTLPSLRDTYDLTLSELNSYHFKVPPAQLPIRTRTSLGATQFISEVDSMLAQGDEFGISPQEKQDLVISALATARDLPPSEVRAGILPWASKFSDGDYDESFRTALAEYSGTRKIPVSPDGYQRLDTLRDLGLAYTAPVAMAYSAHVAANVETQIAVKQQEAPAVHATWIPNRKLTGEFQWAARVAGWSGDNNSLEELKRSYEMSIQPSTRLLNSNDRGEVKAAVKKAEDVIEK